MPEIWNEAIIILLHKKGDQKNISNYRPISLLNNIYKLFTKIITNRITRTLDENQPREQAGFRRGFSTIDHLHAVNQLIEKCAEYKIPLVVTTAPSRGSHYIYIFSSNHGRILSNSINCSSSSRKVQLQRSEDKRTAILYILC